MLELLKAKIITIIIIIIKTNLVMETARLGKTEVFLFISQKGLGNICQIYNSQSVQSHMTSKLLVKLVCYEVYMR